MLVILMGIVTPSKERLCVMGTIERTLDREYWNHQWVRRIGVLCWLLAMIIIIIVVDIGQCDQSEANAGSDRQSASVG